MKIALASSGLGHVSRGIETWTRDSAEALAQQAAGSRERGENIKVVLFSGAKTDAGGQRLEVRVLSCMKRSSAVVRLLAKIMPGFTWRWGWKSPVGWEQYTFWKSLRKELKKGKFDILHTQEALLAKLCQRDADRGYWNGKVILAHGTEEPPEFLAQFRYVQHLTPWHREQFLEALTTEAQRGCAAEGAEDAEEQRFIATDRNRRQTVSKRRHAVSPDGETTVALPMTAQRMDFVIPNFVDVNVFRPTEDIGEKCKVESEKGGMDSLDLAPCTLYRSKTEIRRSCGIADGAFVIGCVAAVKKGHKRIDYLIREFAALGESLAQSTQRNTEREPVLLIAGAKTEESEGLVKMAEELAPGRVKFLFDLPREKMPDLYRAMDVFVLTSLFEMMPIAILEALSSGVSCIVNKHPNLEWMIGGGGMSVDMSEAGTLAKILERHTTEDTETQRRKARAKAEASFSKEVVIPQMVEMYRQVMNDLTGKSEF